MSRLAWYLAPYMGRIDTIHLSVANNEWLGAVELAPNLDPLISDRLPSILRCVALRSVRGLAHEIGKADPTRDIVLIVDERAEVGMPHTLKAQIDAFIQNGGRYRVDPVRTRQEGSFYLWAGLNKLSDSAALTAEHARRFDAMSADIGRHDKAYVFGTGPSFTGFIESHDFSDGLTIVANSIVKNDAALDILKPRIICAGDPIYHAGCSSYAAAFRQSLLSALEKTNAWFVCPLRDAGVYRAFLPPHLEPRMVCVPFDKTKPIPINMTRDFYFNPFPNILTLALLPLAATFARAIHIVGCDGRKLLDDSFFWSHDKKVQFNEQMTEIQAAHPGFFSIDYNDYYLDHCLDVERTLSTLEGAGRDVVTETPSLIPALAHRYTCSMAPAAAPDLRTFVMLDPDAKDDWGHFLAYDKRVASAVRALGLDFALLSRRELATSYRPQHASSMHQVFTVNSWTIGNKAPPTRDNVLRFARELAQGLEEVEDLYPTGDIAVFFYVGSLEAAEMLEFLLADHPRVHAVVNLFWSYAFDQREPAYSSRWQAVAQRMQAHPRLHLMHASGQIADEFARDWDLALPVLEHPSTTFSDDDAAALAAMPVTPNEPASGRIRVVFPGGARAEKGFVLSCETVDILRDDAAISLALRARLDKVSGLALHQAFAALDTTGIEIIDQDLSDDEFIDMIREADIVVIPYHAEAFRRRTSGILVDAMLLGKPVVVLEDTWLADIVGAEGIGLCVAPTAHGLAEGIRAVARDHIRFAAAIEQARHAYLRTNTWKALVRHVCALTGDPSFAEADPAGAASVDAGVLIREAAALLLGQRQTSELPAAHLEAIRRVLGDDHRAVQHFDRVVEFVAARG